ncbi:hypothetical protein BCR37DRAFT_377438 [Protomyces lactucae-debilis]|uniref:Cryptic loci regulator 2 N-terminal domain-containing protein n=1 Tax=Protomyces lactucae-debilis TaxID=2754530 RepID=A0A1Y2FQ62_PROLT|nr:uncharacterized protein BCR37DRAFT_377438 [Protomyces lactucae-debilis]ORY85737.1 hypothetical protein BCR37DRAFT_377438 [Protomyces lactucae-debilis]
MTEPLAIRCDFSDAIPGQVPAHHELDEDDELSSELLDHYVRRHDGTPRRLRWLSALGQFVKQNTSLRDTAHHYTLDDFPEGYVFLEEFSRAGNYRYKGEASLWGHPSGKHYASVAEFQKHLLWLLLDAQHIPANCLCKLCRQHRTEAQANKVQLGLPVTERAPLMTGMSDIALVIMAKARADQARDLAPHAPIYRSFEIVKHLAKKATFIVVSSRMLVVPDMSPANQLPAPVRVPHYTLVAMNSPHEQLEGVPQADLAPFFAITGDEDQILRDPPHVCSTASPIGKFQLQYADEALQEPIGPRFTGFFLGPEKVYCSDIVRIASREGERTKYKLMQVSDIFLDSQTKIYKVRGDVFAFRHKRDTDVATTPKPIGSDTRPIPAQILQHALIANLDVTFINKPLTRCESVLGDIMGRDYPLSSLPRSGRKFASLASVTLSQLYNCRANALSDELRNRVNELLKAERDEPLEPTIRRGQDGVATPSKLGAVSATLNINGITQSANGSRGVSLRGSPEMDNSLDEPMPAHLSKAGSNTKINIKSSSGLTPKSPHRPALWNPRRQHHGATSATGNETDHGPVRRRISYTQATSILPDHVDQSNVLPNQPAKAQRAGRTRPSGRTGHASSDSSDGLPVVRRKRRSNRGTSRSTVHRIVSHGSDSSADADVMRQQLGSSQGNVASPKVKQLAQSGNEEDNPILHRRNIKPTQISSRKRQKRVALSAESSGEEQEPLERQINARTPAHQETQSGDRARNLTDVGKANDSTQVTRKVRGGPSLPGGSQPRQSNGLVRTQPMPVASERPERQLNTTTAQQSNLSIAQAREKLQNLAGTVLKGNSTMVNGARRPDKTGSVSIIHPSAKQPVRAPSIPSQQNSGKRVQNTAGRAAGAPDSIDDIDLFATTASEYSSD